MALTLAVLEGGTLFAAVCWTIFVWAHPVLLDWIDVLTLLAQALAFSLSCIIAFYYNDLYDLRIVQSFGEFAWRLLQAFGVAFILLAVFYSIFPETRIAQGPFVSSLLLMVGFLLPLRVVSYGFMRCRLFLERVLILGTGSLAEKLSEEIEARPHVRYRIVGVVEDATSFGDLPSSHTCLGPLDRLAAVIDDVHPDRIIVALAERRGRLPLSQLLEARARGIVVEDGVVVYERLARKLAVESLRPSSLVFSTDFRKSGFDVAVGRATSLLASAVGLVAFGPLLGLIALAIRLDTAGPVLFGQDRIGLHGRRFTLLKFRTMRPVLAGTTEWVRDNSDRITRVGKWLRKFRLDELPQFCNIVRGDMNLVGPRPHPVSNLPLFTERIPYYSLRSMVRPGLTGWAQVRYGYANNLEEEIEKMRYDLYYIKHLSFWFDLRILIDTVKIVLFGRGAKATDASPAQSLAAAKR